MAVHNLLNAQVLQIDSLENLLNTKLSDETRVIVLNDLSFEYCEKDPVKALKYAEDACRISHEIKFIVGLKKSYGQMGTAYLYLGNPAKAIENNIKCAEYCEKLNDKIGESTVYHNIALIYEDLELFADAKKYILKSLTIDRQLGDKSNYAYSCNSYGVICLDLKDTAEAYRYFEESYHQFVEVGTPEHSSSAVKNLGIILKKQKKYDKAIPFFRLAAEYYQKTDAPKKAAIALWEIAEIYFIQNKNDEAIKYFEESINIFDIYQDDDFKNKGMFRGMALAYAQKNDYKNAYKAVLKANDLMEIRLDEIDSIRTINLDSMFADMAKKYDTERVEKENQIQKLEIDQREKESKTQKMMIFFSVLGFVLVSGLMLLAIRSNKRTQLANKKINFQKEEIERQRDEISVKNREITSSIEYAKTLQDAILPDERYISKHIEKHFILWLPRDIVSGDFYWFYEKDGLIFFAVADCTGHGVPGAFVSMTCHNVLNQVVIDQKIEEPGEILSRVHRIVSNVFHREGSLSTANDGMDVVICCVNKKEMKLKYAGAMNPFIHVKNKIATELKTDRMAIGGRTPHGFQFENHVVSIEKGDWFYMYSDGYQDQFGGINGKKFMSANFKKMLADNSGSNAADQKIKLHESLLKWQRGYDRIDDVLVVGFTIS